MTKIVPASMSNVKLDINGKNLYSWNRSKGVDSYGPAAVNKRRRCHFYTTATYAPSNVRQICITDITDRASLLLPRLRQGAHTVDETL